MREDWPDEISSAEEPGADIEQDPDLDNDVQLTGVERWQHVAALAFAAAMYPLRVTPAAISTFLDNWRASRPAGLIPWGLPAIIALVGAGYLALALPPHASELIVKYRAAAAEAAEAGDTIAAALWLEKTLQLNPLDPDHRYNLAMAAILEDQEERAREILVSLAPEDGLGHPPAHMWMARDLMQHEQSPATARRIEHHLLQSLASGEIEAEAHAMFGEFYLDRNEVNQAIHHFGQAAPERPNSYFSLAQALRTAGRVDESLKSATKSRDYFRQQTEENPEVADHRRGWAFAEQLLGNHQEAVRILEAGLESAESQTFHESLVDVYINWFNDRLLQGKANLAWQLEVLSLALEHGPNDPRLLAQLANLAVRDWEHADEAFVMLKELVARGVAPAIVHLIIGTQELKRGNYDDAKMHLELAHDQAPQAPGLLNNLAWLLAHQDEPDFPRALELAQAAKRLAGRPEIYETVGTILALMGRNREAIAELEIALRGLPDSAELHFKLADAYEQLGENDLVRIHRRLAERETAEP